MGLHRIPTLRRTAPKMANGFVTGSLIHATKLQPSRDVLEQPFQRWLKAALDPSHKAIQILEDFSRMKLVLSAIDVQDFRHYPYPVLEALRTDVGEARERMHASAKEDATFVSRRQMQRMDALADRAVGRLLIPDFHIQLLNFMRDSENWPIELNRGVAAIRQMFRDMKEDESFARLVLEERPTLLAALKLDFGSTGLAIFDMAAAWEKISASGHTNLLIPRQKSDYSQFRDRWIDTDYKVPVHAIDRSVFAAFWITMNMGRGDLWIDLGAGDGANLVSLAHRFSQAQFIGVDYMDAHALDIAYERSRGWPHLSQLSSLKNAHYVAIGQPIEGIEQLPNIFIRRTKTAEADLPQHDLMAKKVPAAVPSGKAKIASLLQPHFYYREREDLGSFNPVTSHRTEMLRTWIDIQIDLLMHGGWGIIATAHQGLANRAVALLKNRAKQVESVYYTDRPFTGDQLSALGIVPYSAFTNKIHTLKREDPSALPAKYGVDNWSWFISFQTR